MNDSRITAYALGELTGKARENFECELGDSDALQAELNETVAIANELAGLPKPNEGLKIENRIDLLRMCYENQVEFQRNKKIKRWVIPAGLGVAATLTFLGSIFFRPTTAELVVTPRSEISAPHTLDNPLLTSGLNQPHEHTEQSLEEKSSISSSNEVNSKNASAESGWQNNSDSKSLTVCSHEHKIADSSLTSQGSSSLATVEFQFETPGKSIPLQENKTNIGNAKNGGVLVNAKINRTSEYSLNLDISNYAKIRQQILRGELPEKSSIHIEDLINAFSYNYSRASGNEFLSTDIEIGKAPWNEKYILVRIGIQANEITENVKAEVIFNPTRVAYYRLIGYENQGDANSEIGVSATVAPYTSHTALYEVIPADKTQPQKSPEGFHRSQTIIEYQPVDTGDFFTLKIHHRPLGSNHCQLLISQHNSKWPKSFDDNTTDFRFAAAVAAFGMKLRGSPESANVPWSKIEHIALTSIGKDQDGQRSDFADLIKKTARLQALGISATSSKFPLPVFGLIF